jgi:hypothetical protein
MDDAMLRADCSACAGLCCVAFAFDRGPLFAFDKAAGEPCGQLGADYRCAIHNRLVSERMSGCAGYDCLGAGQHTTALFAGHSWRDSPATARVMFEAFRKLRTVHELLLLARARADCARVMESLDPPEGWTLTSLLLLDLDAIVREFQGIARATIRN